MRARNAAITAGAVLAVVAVVATAAVLLGGGAAEPAEAPSPTSAPAPTHAPSPTAEPAEPEPTPTPTLEPLEGPEPEGIDEITAQVSALRGLVLKEPLDARVVPRADLGARFAELARTEVDPEVVAADEQLLIALRLLESDVDLLAVLEAFYSEQVLGMYATEEQVLYVGADSPALSPAQAITAAHEITHALQDQHWGLRDLLDFDDHASDRQLAALALVEGDAVLVQEVWSARHQTPAEREDARREALAGGADALRQAPRYVREAVLFPYREGPSFVQALVEHGGFAAVDDAFERLPGSTAEIMDPARYLDGWTPETVDITVDPGVGWEQGSTYEFGAFDLAQLLAPLGQRAEAVAAGWEGGAVRHWLDGDSSAVALTVRFEDSRTAADACNATPAWYAEVAGGTLAGPDTMQGDRDWMSWTCTEREVRMGLAPDGHTAAALAG